ncbi:MAG: heme-binding domain-containing protein [Anaerolineales bacterium]|nr:heme-binding domain-containing protein [Anaerolineales bacterium]
MKALLPKILLIGTAGLLLFLLVIQLVPYGRDHTNPPVTQQVQWDSSRTQELFNRACADCHSNETVWPWYSNVAPVSWLVTHDVSEGREKFNVSQQLSREADEAAEAVQKGEMPMGIYVLMHPTAKLSESEKQELIQGLVNTFGR